MWSLLWYCASSFLPNEVSFLMQILLSVRQMSSLSPVSLSLGHQGATEWQLWLLIAKSLRLIMGLLFITTPPASPHPPWVWKDCGTQESHGRVLQSVSDWGWGVEGARLNLELSEMHDISKMQVGQVRGTNSETLLLPLILLAWSAEVTLNQFPYDDVLVIIARLHTYYCTACDANL